MDAWLVWLFLAVVLGIADVFTLTAVLGHGRLLAYFAPNFTAAERTALSREQRSTFNLDLLTAGWAARNTGWTRSISPAISSTSRG